MSRSRTFSLHKSIRTDQNSSRTACRMSMSNLKHNRGMTLSNSHNSKIVVKTTELKVASTQPTCVVKQMRMATQRPLILSQTTTASRIIMTRVGTTRKDRVMSTRDMLGMISISTKGMTSKTTSNTNTTIKTNNSMTTPSSKITSSTTTNQIKATTTTIKATDTRPTSISLIQ